MAYYTTMFIVTRDVADPTQSASLLAGERLFYLSIDGFGVYVNPMGNLVCTEHSALGQTPAGAVQDAPPRTWYERVVFELGEAPMWLLRRTLDILMRDGKVTASDIVAAALEATK